MSDDAAKPPSSTTPAPTAPEAEKPTPGGFARYWRNMRAAMAAKRKPKLGPNPAAKPQPATVPSPATSPGTPAAKKTSA